eukprot:845542-Rhodomonas_salina.1
MFDLLDATQDGSLHKHEVFALEVVSAPPIFSATHDSAQAPVMLVVLLASYARAFFSALVRWLCSYLWTCPRIRCHERETASRSDSAHPGSVLGTRV